MFLVKCQSKALLKHGIPQMELTRSANWIRSALSSNVKAIRYRTTITLTDQVSVVFLRGPVKDYQVMVS